MTCTLILTRHAKSSWDDLTLSDHARPLNKRGRKSATAIGAWLQGQGLAPDVVVSSSSARTRETWARMGLQTSTELFTSDLYHASANQILHSLHQAQGSTVLLLGHNPGIAEFAEAIVSTPPAHPRFTGYPTGATTVIRFETDTWADVHWRDGQVLDFIIPRELPV